MMYIINIAQVIISLLLIAGVLVQQRGEGLSPVFGGDSGAYRTRRGAEKSIFIATIILSVLFLVTAVLGIIWK